MTVNREDVVQAALLLERWCIGRDCRTCPLMGEVGDCMAKTPEVWDLEEKLRMKGMRHD